MQEGVPKLAVHQNQHGDHRQRKHQPGRLIRLRPLAPDHCMCPDAEVELHEIAIAVLSTLRRNANGAHRLGRMR
jgi:hypothetical protein